MLTDLNGLVLATIFALVTFALSAQSKTAETSLTDSTNPAKSLAYSSMGIAAGVLTLITVPFMYASLL